MIDKERIKHCFSLMNYDALTEPQHDLIISCEKQFLKKEWLSDRQIEILEDIFRKAGTG